MKEIKVKYFSNDYEKLERIDGEKSDWIDLRVDSIISTTRKSILFDNVVEKIKPDTISYQAGDILFLGLGIAMELPDGYEAHIVPRSSMFKNTGFLLTNGMGIIDNSYSGNDDEWKAMVYCTRDGIINRHDRLFQFRIIEKQPEINFKEVDKLEGKNRGGYGSTGIK